MAAIIRKATVKSYSATTHEATVQVAGSLGVWLDAVRVATDIPAADVVAGRQCTVLFLDPANQDDAVVITIQGALPSGGGGPHAHAETDITDGALLARVAAAETWAALQTFSAGLKLAAAQAIQDSGGAARLTPATASPHVTLTGDLHVTGPHAKVGLTAPGATTIFEAQAPASGAFAELNLIKASHIGTGMPLSGIAAVARGVFGLPIAVFPAGTLFGSMYGLQFEPIARGGGAGDTLAIHVGVRTGWHLNSFTGTVTNAKGIEIVTPTISGVNTIATAHGIHINAQHHANIVNAYGIQIADFTLNTGFTYLLEIGPATPYLRVVGKAAPGALLTNVWMDVGAVGLRQLQVGAANSGGAGFRQVIVLN